MKTETNNERGPYKMSPKDMETTAKTLAAYAENFQEVAEAMRQRDLDSIEVTGLPSVLAAFKRLDGHYLSARESLSILSNGQPMPVYDFAPEPEKSKPASKKTKRT